MAVASGTSLYPFKEYETGLADVIRHQLSRATTPEASFKHYYYQWRKVMGYLSDEQGEWLFEAAKTVAAEGDIVEIGSFFGKSTIAMALGAKIHGNGRLYAIDPHTGGVTLSVKYPEATQAKASLGALIRNMVRFNVEDIVEPVVSTSRQAVQTWRDKPVRLLFIDGWHTYEECSHDILEWGKLVAPGGAIAIDDYHWDDVKKAIHDCLPRLDGFGEVQSITHKMAVAYRSPKQT